VVGRSGWFVVISGWQAERRCCQPKCLVCAGVYVIAESLIFVPLLGSNNVAPGAYYERSRDLCGICCVNRDCLPRGKIFPCGVCCFGGSSALVLIEGAASVSNSAPL
jgi:hypothetical protein